MLITIKKLKIGKTLARRLFILALISVFFVLFTGPPSAFAREKKFKGGMAPIELAKHYNKAFKGKTIAWVPVALGLPLTDGWTYVIKTEAEKLGMKFILRDPNWDPNVQEKAVRALINQKPDVLIVHNQNVSLLAKLIEKAEKKGIHVVQVNMISKYISGGYVGVDWTNMGETIAKDMVKECGQGTNTSHKVAIVQGVSSSAANIYQLAGMVKVLKADSSIKIVSSQAADWDPKKAHDNTAVTLQQHPDLCATVGFWGIMQMGAAQAVKEAKLSDKVLVYASGGGPQVICDNIKNNLIDRYWNYDTLGQGRDIINMVKILLQSGGAPGDHTKALFSPMVLVTKENADNACWSLAEIGQG